MKIATWNCGRGKADSKLPLLIERYEVDIAAVQEIADPGDGRFTSAVWKGTRNKAGILVWARQPYRAERIKGFRCPTAMYLPVRIFRGNRHLFNVCNLWVKPYDERPPGECRYGYSLKTGLEMLMKAAGSGRNVVLGDFNILDPDSKDWYRNRLAEYGLFSAYHDFHKECSGQESRPTHVHRTRKTPHHIDFFFLPEAWRPGLRNVNVGAAREWASFSDHFPICVEIDTRVIEGR